MHSDSAPTFYVNGNPDRTDPTLRTMERNVFGLNAIDPYVSPTAAPVFVRMADKVEEKTLHMQNSDANRTPSFTGFADPNYFLFAGAPNCNAACVTENPAFAWNHGDVSPDINTTWLGIVGPGVRQLGVDGKIWSDHTDIRPTMLVLLGLKDDPDTAHKYRQLVRVWETHESTRR